MQPLIVLILSAVIAMGTISASAEPLPSSNPEQVGLSSQRLARLSQALKADADKGKIPGAVALVSRKGRVAYFEAFGFRDKASGAPMTRDAIFRIYSMTKPITSVAAMMLVEEGKILLTDPASKYLPALAKLKVAVPRLDPGTGVPSRRAGARGCLSQSGSAGACQEFNALDSGAGRIAFAPGGLMLYAASFGSGLLGTFARDFNDSLGNAAPFFEEPGGPMLRHGATYAGHPTVCAASLAVLNIYERENIIPRARELEGVLAEVLEPLASHPAVAEVRAGLGLLAAVHLHDASAVPTVAAGAREAGVLVRPLIGALAVSPPLIVEREPLEQIADGYRAGLDRV